MLYITIQNINNFGYRHDKLGGQKFPWGKYLKEYKGLGTSNSVTSEFSNFTPN